MVNSHDVEPNIKNLPSKFYEQVHKAIVHPNIKAKYLIYLIQLFDKGCKYFLLEKNIPVPFKTVPLLLLDNRM